jgi:hypothetical protein
MPRERRGISHDYQANMDIYAWVKCALANDLCLSSIYYANDIDVLTTRITKHLAAGGVSKQFAKLKLHQCVSEIKASREER